MCHFIVKLPWWRRLFGLTPYYVTSNVISNSHTSLHLLFKMASCGGLLQKRKQNQRHVTSLRAPEWDSVLRKSGSFCIHCISPSSFPIKLRWFIFLFTQQIFEHLHNTLGPAIYKSWTEYWGSNSVKKESFFSSTVGKKDKQTGPTSQYQLSRSVMSDSVWPRSVCVCVYIYLSIYLSIYLYIMSRSDRVQLRLQF